MSHLRASAVFLSLLAILLQCSPERVSGGAGAGNPPQALIAFSVEAVAAPPLAKAGSPARNPAGTFLVKDSAGADISITALGLEVAQLSIPLPAGRSCLDVKGIPCSDGKVRLMGLHQLDLVAGSAHPEFPALKLPAGIYREFHLGPDSSDGEGPDGVDSMNFRISGSLDSGVSFSRKFVLDLALEDDIGFLDSIGVNTLADSLNRIVLSLRVDGWFSGVDMRKCLEGGEGKADSAGTLHIRGNGACAGIGHRIGVKVDESGDVEEEEEYE